jgi:hypothetical protein
VNGAGGVRKQLNNGRGNQGCARRGIGCGQKQRGDLKSSFIERRDHGISGCWGKTVLDKLIGVIDSEVVGD